MHNPGIVVRAHGGPECMQLANQSVGQPGPHQALVRHHAIGLNFIDVYQRTGLYPLQLPHGLGMEGAGVVEALGDEVTHVQVGDRVAYAASLPGSYCLRRVMPAHYLCRLPEQLSFATGAAMMLKGMTVRYLLKSTRPRDGLHKGDFILWHAAAGGVGLIACQWARAMGLQLIGTAGNQAKCQLALQHGAAYAIDYSREDFVARVQAITNGRGVAVFYDAVGLHTFEKSLDCLRPFGLAVNFGNASGKVPPIDPGLLAAKGSLYLTRPLLHTYLANRTMLEAMATDLFGMVTSGKLQICIDQRYPLGEVQLAHRQLEARKTTGSSLLLPPQDA